MGNILVIVHLDMLIVSVAGTFASGAVIGWVAKYLGLKNLGLYVGIGLGLAGAAELIWIWPSLA